MTTNIPAGGAITTKNRKLGLQMPNGKGKTPVSSGAIIVFQTKLARD